MNGPKFRLVSDGKHTYFELCGKSIGKGISSVSYVHEAGGNPEILFYRKVGLFCQKCLRVKKWRLVTLYRSLLYGTGFAKRSYQQSRLVGSTG